MDIRPDNMKLLEENIVRTVFDINQSKIFFNLPPRVMKIKTIINKWDLVKLYMGRAEGRLKGRLKELGGVVIYCQHS